MMARSQSLATAILGLWVGITLFMWFAAGKSFSTVNRILQAQNPELVKITKPLSPAETREVLRHLASEINRTFFGTYNWVQVVLGALLLFLLLRQTPRDITATALVGAMFVIILILSFIVTPQIVTLGRSLDFVPRIPPPPEMGRFRMLHAAYTGLDGIKLLGGLALLARWIVR
jgi:hypothetical protein